MQDTLHKTLLIRFSSVGDIVLASPLVRVLRRRFPGIRIDFAVKSEYADLVRFDPGIAKVLKESVRHPRVRIAVISGRSVRDLKRKIPLPGLYLAGGHGLEIQGRGLRFLHPVARLRGREVKTLARALRRALAGFAGALVEEKELSVAAHYRMVPRSMVPDVRKAIRRTLAAQAGDWKVITGKQVIEALPRTGWTKGSCVRLLWAHYCAELPSKASTLAFYIGDDQTDQDGFEAVKGIGVSLAVGEKPRLRADYHLKNVDEVSFFLKKVEKALVKK